MKINKTLRNEAGREADAFLKEYGAPVAVRAMVAWAFHEVDRLYKDRKAFKKRQRAITQGMDEALRAGRTDLSRRVSALTLQGFNKDSRLQKLSAALAELVEACEMEFVQATQPPRPYPPDEMKVTDAWNDCALTFGHIRRARAALDESGMLPVPGVVEYAAGEEPTQ